MLAQASVATCDAAASSANQPFVADAVETMNAWKVQRLYYPADFGNILDGLINLVSNTSDAMYDAAGVAPDAGIGSEYQAQWKVLRGYFEQPSLTNPTTLHTYIDAHRAAANQGKKAIESTDFKEFARKVLLECAKGRWMLEFVKCRRTVSAKLLEFFRTVMGIVKAIMAAVASAAEAVVETAKDIYKVASSTAAVLWMIIRRAPLVLGVGVAGFASYKAYKVYRERHPRAALPAGDEQEQD